MNIRHACRATADEWYEFSGDPDHDKPAYWVARHATDHARQRRLRQRLLLPALRHRRGGRALYRVVRRPAGAGDCAAPRCLRRRQTGDNAVAPAPPGPTALVSPAAEQMRCERPAGVIFPGTTCI
jgi:hypothetical protein